MQQAHQSLRNNKHERGGPHRNSTHIKQSKQVIKAYRNHINVLENAQDPISPLQNARNDHHRLLQEKDALDDEENYEACTVIMYAIGSCARKIHRLDQTNQGLEPPPIRKYDRVMYPELIHQVPILRLRGGNLDINVGAEQHNPETYLEYLNDIATDTETRNQLQQLNQPTQLLQKFLDTLHPSERTLIQSVELSIPLEDMISQWDTIATAASDGSVKDEKGTFGWSISRFDGTRIASCKGQSHGTPMTSHRAEAFGMWSVFVFVTRIFQFYNKDPTGQVSLHCDNEALVNTVNKIITRARPDFPNDTLEADWDIIHEIVLLLRAHDQSVSWIASHQDEDTPKEDLPLAAQLNCEADTLADEAHAI